MTEEWVDAVWEESLVHNIISTEKQFDEYKCPPFYKLNITTSGLEGINREKIVTLISENGKNHMVSLIGIFFNYLIF